MAERKRYGFYKPHTMKSSIASAISEGYSALQELRDEMAEIADNMENAGMGHIQKCEDARSAADALDGCCEEPSEDVPPEDDTPIDVVIQVPRRKGKATGRAVRRDNAVTLLQVVVDELDSRISEIDEDEDDEDGSKASRKDALEEIKDHLENSISEAEGVGFPGMYG